ncbi:MAG: discoidin domain-containing protein [Oscillospiraceae bacterium]
MKAGFDLSDAYYGGTSVAVKGGMEAGKPVNIRLFATNLSTNENQQITVTYKTPAEKANMKVGLKFTNTLDNEVGSDYVTFDVEDGTPGEWKTCKIDLPSEYVGRYIREIGLVFESDTDVADYKINIGELGITDKTKTSFDAKVENAKIEKVSYPSAMTASIRAIWDRVDGASEYELYKINADGSRSFLGSTPNRAFYVSKILRDSNTAKSSTVEVVPVDAYGNRGQASTMQFNWILDPDADLEIPDGEEEPVNLALNNPNVVASNEIKTEPAKNAVDGIVVNNSKWCVENGYNQWIRVSYDEPITVQRYMLIHAGHPDAGETDNMNTRGWRLEYSDDGNTWKIADEVTDNTANLTNINLDAPVTGKYFRLTITRPGQNVGVLRLYEWQLFEKQYTFKTGPINESDVTVENHDGATDIVEVKGVNPGETVRLYHAYDAENAFAEMAVEEGADRVVFENVELNANGGKVFWSRQAEANAKVSAGANAIWRRTPTSRR